MSINGFKVVITPTRLEPKLKLGSAAPVSNECRLEFDSWLLEMFGAYDRSLIPIGQCYAIGDTLVMRAETAKQLDKIKKELK
jgi:hypothetical protein